MSRPQVLGPGPQATLGAFNGSSKGPGSYLHTLFQAPMRRFRSAIAAATLLPFASLGQIVLDNTITPTQAVVDVLLGQGVTVSNITFNGQPGNLLNEQIGGFDATNAILGINEGVIIATGSIGNAVGPNNSGSSSLGGGNFGQTDPDLVLLSGNPSINDAGILEFDFVPTGDSLKFDFIFASEEYLEFVNSVNDAFGFFISGPGINGPYQNNAINIALVPGTTQPVTINDVNSTVNSTYYVDNGDGWTAPYNTNPQYVQYDGHTVVMTAKTEVTCGVTYHIKICIGDASDTAWDSAVFLQAGSFTSSGQVVPELTGDLGGVGSNDSTLFEGCGIIPLVFHRYGDTTNVDTVNLIIGGTATGGVDYSPAFPVQLIYQPGDTIIPWPVTVPLDADGLETITIGIAQNIVCSGQQILNEYVLYIDQYPALNVVTNDVDGDCGGQYTLTPVITGGTGLAQILWDTGETTTSITVSPGVTTTYDFTVTDTCSLSPVDGQITVTIPVYEPMAVEVSPLTLIDCLSNGDIAVTNVTGGDGDYDYAWTFEGAPYGTTPTVNVPAANPTVWYVATVTDGCGSTATDSVEVGTVPLEPIVIESPDRTVICLGDTTTLEVLSVTGGNGVYTYTWTNAQQQTISQTTSVDVPVPSDAVYTITVEDQCGYSGSEQVNTLIPHPAPFILRLNNDTVLCAGDSLTLWAQVSGGSGYYTVQWEGLDHSDPLLAVSPPVNANYRVYIFDQCGEVITDDVNVGVEQAVADIRETNQGQDDWLFEPATWPTFCRSYRWDLGDGTTSRDRIVTHSYLDLEEHWVKLEVVSFTGCTAVDSTLIRPPGQLFFPNAFTPDGDGINETFGPATRYIESFEMSIFDRWGHLVYHSEDINKPWDGKTGNGKIVQGVYVYRYKAAGHLFPSTEGMGHVTLLGGSTTD